MNITIRNAKIEDISELQKLFLETIMKTCENEYTLEQRIAWSAAAKETEKWNQALKHEFFIVAESEGIIVGFSSLKNQSYLNLMYVHKDFIRKGIARLLYKKIKAKSLEHGVEKLNVDASIVAKPFFEKLGFRALKENKNLIKNEVVINYRMTE